ncbi:TonB family protein [Pigmentiphaga soli]|uniref:TonB family protein n=1 Tax=Pigmentiphaga soli TaxID=1007095 RepID=A0ABP8GUQ6_9BURK
MGTPGKRKTAPSRNRDIPIPAPHAGTRQRLAIGAAVSLAFHGALLGIGFVPPAEKPPRHDTGLEVVLLNAGTRSAPARAELRAQVDSDGGGDSNSGHSRAPVQQSAPDRDGELLASLRERQAALEARQRQLAAQVRQRLAAASDGRTQAGPAAATGAERRDNSQLARRFAEIAERVEDYNKRPRKHFFAPSTSEYRYAAYVEQWRRRIEAVGNRHYPAAARGKLYGSLRMTVYIRADGTVDGIDLGQPSRHRVLNDAARRIVSLAAPFPPFPPEIRRDTDILAITRTWHFTHGKLTATAR